MLARESQNTTYFDSDSGERKFLNCGSKIYEPCALSKNAYHWVSDYVEDFSPGWAREWAVAAKALVEEDDQSKLDALKNSGSVKNAAADSSSPSADPDPNPGSSPGPGSGSGSPGSRGGRSRREVQAGGDEDGEGEGPGSRRESGTGSSTGTNGLGTNPTDTPQNRRSERSDGSGEVDICFVNPPVRERCNRQQWARLTRVTESIQEQLVVLQLINSSWAATYNSGEEEDGRWVVMSHEVLHEEYKVPYPTENMWRNSSIIEAKQDGRYVSPDEAREKDERPEARELRVTQEFLDEWTRLGAEGGAYRYKAHRRKLVRTREPQAMTTQLYDENRNDIPELVEDALRVLQDVNQEIIVSAIEEAEESIANREGAEARDQLTSLRLAKETVERQVIQQQNGVAQLQNAYEIQEISGRVSFKRGGPQGLMGEVKAKAYDLDGYRNFDIKSCHTSAFKQVAKMLGNIGVDINVTAWERYPGKYEVAANTGLPVSLVKVVEHAVKYGAVIPHSLDQARYYEEQSGHYPAIAQEVKKQEQQGLLEDADAALETLNDLFVEMREVVIEMAEALLTDFYDAHHSGGWMENACGVSFGRHTWAEGHEQRSKVMAWMLQGLEAAFCHWITKLSAESEAFTVVANEHDGLIIRKDVDDEQAFQDALSAAISKAQERSGFEEAEFVEKAFADEEDVQELYGEDEEAQEESNGEEPQRQNHHQDRSTLSKEEANRRRLPSWHKSRREEDFQPANQQEQELETGLYTEEVAREMQDNEDWDPYTPPGL
jgi:hypothetical protein